MTLTIKKSTKLISLLVGIASTQALYAGHHPMISKEKEPIVTPVFPYVATLSVGPAWLDGGKTQTFYLAPEIQKTYTANKTSNTLVDGELFLGMQRQLWPSITGQLGLAGAITSSAKISGVIWDDANPIFNNYSYKYRVRHAHVAVAGKLLAANTNFFLIPWVGASVGVGFNQAHEFDNTPLIFEAVKNTNFSSNTTTTFTYTLSAGLQKNISPNCQVGVGYQFADWGKTQLGRALGQTLGNGLKNNHIYTNGVMFNITYMS